MNPPFSYEFDRKNLRHWCFDDCPEAELMACWHYEYLRDCQSVIDRVLAWREKWLQEQREYSRAEIILNIFYGHPYERLIAEWPETPYLDINPKDRRIYLDVRKRLGAMERDCIRDRQLRDRQSRDPVAHFPIMDWSDPPAEQFKQLRKFVKDNRPRNCVVERRGKPTIKRSLSQKLKALGAWRLSRVMPQSEVINHAVGLGKPLYKNRPELSKVVKRTARYLDWLDQTPVDP
jgi:hypothetical protein